MDWRHAAFTAESSAIWLLAIVAVSALAAVLAKPGRRLVAASPAILAAPLVGACSYLSGIPDIQHANWSLLVPNLGFATVALLVVPSTLAQRSKWFGLLHVVTLAACALLWFICGVSISQDGP